MQPRKPARRFAAALLVSVLPSLPTAATAPSATPATLEGAVVSASTRTPLAGVTVWLGDPHDDTLRSVAVGGDGRFLVRDLPPATYDLAVESGARLYTVSSPVRLEAGDRRSLALAIPVGATAVPAADDDEKEGRTNWWNNPATATLVVLAGAVVVGLVIDAAIDDTSPLASPSSAP